MIRVQGFNNDNDKMRLITKTKDDLDKSVVNDAGEYVDDVEDGECHDMI